jgi:uncharacterized protein YjiS (DUF1127 family)
MRPRLNKQTGAVPKARPLITWSKPSLTKRLQLSCKANPGSSASLQSLSLRCEKIAAAIARRRIRGARNKLDDYLLKDMGIARSDIERISNRTHSPHQ